jgi:hypothetical protein
MVTVTNNDLHDPGTPPRWRKARRSGGGGGGGGGDCVEVAWLDEHGARAFRDTKLDQTGPILTMSAANWHALRAAALNGTLDIQ